MKPNDDYKILIRKAERLAYTALLVMGVAMGIAMLHIYDPSLQVFESSESNATQELVDEDAIVNGIHLQTGFVDDTGLMTVVNNCTNCHSAQLVIQNRMSKERWNATIKWMQETQNLWDLGENQEIIVNYLVKNYPAIDKGRREGLKNIDWYELN